MPVSFEKLTRQYPPQFKSRKFYDDETALKALEAHSVSLDNDGKLIPTCNEKLKIAMSNASGLVDRNGDLVCIPERPPGCYGIPRIFIGTFSHNCTDCRHAKNCEKIVNARIALGLDKGLRQAKSENFRNSTTIFGAAEVLYGWAHQTREMSRKRSDERKAARQDRENEAARQKRAAESEQRTQQKEAQKRASERRIIAAIDSARDDSASLKIEEALLEAADQLRSQREFRKPLANANLPSLCNAWIARRAVETAGLQDDVHSRKWQIFAYCKISEETRSAHATGQALDKKLITLNSLRSLGYNI